MAQTPNRNSALPQPQGGELPDLGTRIHDRGWISLREFLSVADITYPTALRWCRLKMINYVQVGGTKRIYAEEIARFLKYGTLTPEPKAHADEKARRLKYLTPKPKGPPS